MVFMGSTFTKVASGIGNDDILGFSPHSPGTIQTSQPRMSGWAIELEWDLRWKKERSMSGKYGTQGDHLAPVSSTRRGAHESAGPGCPPADVHSALTKKNNSDGRPKIFRSASWIW
jgi:hypothetical protein